MGEEMKEERKRMIVRPFFPSPQFRISLTRVGQLLMHVIFDDILICESHALNMGSYELEA